MKEQGTQKFGLRDNLEAGDLTVRSKHLLKLGIIDVLVQVLDVQVEVVGLGVTVATALVVLATQKALALGLRLSTPALNDQVVDFLAIKASNSLTD